jgi:ERCC4-type nuclease
MQLFLDFRERELIERLPSASVKGLTLGDAVVELDGKELVIVERKTLADLAASITDGRYKEQSQRLAAYDIPNHNVLYLIEGSFKTYAERGVPKSTLYSCMVSLLYGKGFSVVRTESADQTADFLKALCAKLEKEKGYQHPVKEGASSIKKERKDSITPANIHELMLSQIPFVSTAIAGAVLAQHKTVQALVGALEKDRACLDATSLNGKKLSSRAIDNIKLFLLP